MLILISLQALLNTWISPKIAFNIKSKFVQTKSLSLFATALVIILTFALVFSSTYVNALLTFTSNFSIFIAYTCLVLCFNLINLILAVRTFVFVCTSTLLKSSFIKVKEHAKRSYSLIVISCFITLSKIAFRFVASCIIFKYYFFKVLCLLQTALRLSFTFTKTALFVRLSSFISLFVTFVTIASFYSLVCIIFKTANLCFVSLVLFRIFVRFFYFLSLIQVCFT
jgi:hypothetical protein